MAESVEDVLKEMRNAPQMGTALGRSLVQVVAEWASRIESGVAREREAVLRVAEEMGCWIAPEPPRKRTAGDWRRETRTDAQIDEWIAALRKAVGR